jgi:hypothetical protein
VRNSADISLDDLFLGRFYSAADDDEDGVIDVMEEKYGVPTRTEDGYERLYLDPSRPDSDGDGLLDGEEFESEREFQAGPLSPFERYVSYPLKSHPKRVDSDGDGLVDLAERKFGTNPLDGNPDGDQFSDFADPAPNTENRLPSMGVVAEPSFRGYDLKVNASDEAGLETIRLVSWIQSPPIGPTKFVREADDLDSLAHTEEWFVPGAPKNFTLVAVDENGNRHTATFRYEGNSFELAERSVTLASAGALGSVGRTASASAFSVPATTLSIVTIAAGVGYVLYKIEQNDEMQRTYQQRLRVTPEVETYNDGDVVLTEGYVQRRDGFVRGYGWEYIQATTGVTQDQIGEVLENGERIGGSNRIDLIIGEVGGKSIILRLSAGTVVSATNGQYIEDPNGDKIILDRNDRHIVRDDPDHPNSYDPVERTIRNPDEIWENGRNRVYVKRINGRWLVVRVYREGTGWTVSTAVYEGTQYSDVEDLLKRKNYNIPGDRIYKR